NTTTLKKAIEDLGQSILITFSEKLINKALDNAAEAFARFVVDIAAKSNVLRLVLGLGPVTGVPAGYGVGPGTPGGLGAEYYAAGAGQYMQHGGPVRARQPVIVGEAGPELWWPDAAGKIVPAGQGGAGGRDGPVINIYNNAPGVDVSAKTSRMAD